MKEPQIDVYGTTVAKHLNTVGFKNKFLRLWGHNGTVLNERHNYYPKMSAADADLFRLLGVYKELKKSAQKMEGVEKAWIYMNASKANPATITEDTLIQDLEFNVPDGQYTVKITPNGTYTKQGNNIFNQRVVVQADDTLGIVSDTYTDVNGLILKDQLKQHIVDNYADVLANYLVVGSESPEDGQIDAEVANLVSMYALGGTNAFSVDIVDIGYTLVENSITVQNGKDIDGEATYDSYNYNTKAIYIDLDIKQIGIVTSTDPMVVSIVASINAYKARQAKERKLQIDSLRNTESNAIGAMDKLQLITNDIWLASRMRVTAFDIDTIKSKDLVPIIQQSIDTGYRKKKAKWYSKLLVIIVFVVVMIYCQACAGAGAGALANAAAATALATLAVTLTSMAMAAWGDTAGAGFGAKFSKVTGILSSFLGVTAMLQNVFKQIAAEATKQAIAEGAKEGVKLSATEAAKQVTLKNTIDAIAQIVKGMFGKTATDVSLEQVVSSANKVFKYTSDNELERLSDRVRTEEAKAAEYAQYEESSKAMDFGRQFIVAQAEVFHKQSVDMYDTLYEPWRSPMHIGNMCKTSWKWNRTGIKDGLSNVKV